MKLIDIEELLTIFWNISAIDKKQYYKLLSWVILAKRSIECGDKPKVLELIWENWLKDCKEIGLSYYVYEILTSRKWF